MKSCKNCMFYIPLNDFINFDSVHLRDGFTGCCDLDYVYTNDDYTCKYFYCKE